MSMISEQPDRELAPLVAPVSLIATPSRPARRARVGRVLGATAGIGTMVFSAFGMLGALIESAHDPLSTTVGVAMLFAIFGIAGGLLARRMLRSRSAGVGRASLTAAGAPALALLIRQRMLAVASQYRGRVTAAELAAALGIEQGPAAHALEAAAQSGEARMLFSPEGVAVFEFTGLVVQKAEAKEPWQL